jgi:hypothetical protein
VWLRLNLAQFLPNVIYDSSRPNTRTERALRKLGLTRKVRREIEQR